MTEIMTDLIMLNMYICLDNLFEIFESHKICDELKFVQ